MEDGTGGGTEEHGTRDVNRRGWARYFLFYLLIHIFVVPILSAAPPDTCLILLPVPSRETYLPPDATYLPPPTPGYLLLLLPPTSSYSLSLLVIPTYLLISTPCRPS
eukprot:9478035-Pyramimonas_sp.AAC.2